jgi:hypothetical protein
MCFVYLSLYLGTWQDIYLPEFMNYCCISLWAILCTYDSYLTSHESFSCAAFNGRGTSAWVVGEGTHTNRKASLCLWAACKYMATRPTHWWEEYAALFPAQVAIHSVQRLTPYQNILQQIKCMLGAHHCLAKGRPMQCLHKGMHNMSHVTY